MIESTVIEYLSTALSVPVSGNVPSNPPQRFVTVERTGGERTNWIDTATLAIQSWAESTAAAAELNELVIGKMTQITQKAEISSAELTATYNYTDTARNFPRYQSVFELVHY